MKIIICLIVCNLAAAGIIRLLREIRKIEREEKS